MFNNLSEEVKDRLQIVFCFFCGGVLAVVLTYALPFINEVDPQLPDCSYIAKTELPGVINHQWVNGGGTSTFEDFSFTNIAGVVNDRKDGSRVCGADVTMKNNGKVFSNHVEYEIKYTDFTKAYYNVKVYFQGELK